MKLLLFCVLLVNAASAAGEFGSVGPGTGVVIPSTDSSPCAQDAQLCLNFDGPTQSIGIGCWTAPICDPTPIESTTWGKIKHLYR